MDQRRILLAVGLSLLVVVLYQQLVLKRYQPSGHRGPAEQVGEPAAPERRSTATATPTPTAPAPTPAPEPPKTALAVSAAGAPVVTIETDLYSATLTARGGRLQTFLLKRYRRTVAADSPSLNLVDGAAELLPLTLQIGGSTTDAGVDYRADRDRIVVSGDEEGEVVFTGARPDGQPIEKRIRVRGDRYLFNMSVSTPGSTIGIVMTPIASEGAVGGNTPGVEHAVAFDAASRRVTEHAVADLAKGAIGVDAVLWAGFSAQYFASLAMPTDGTARTVMGSADGVPVIRVDAPVAGGQASYGVFLGPKDPDVLARLGHELDRLVDFGWFWFIAQPLLRLLELLHAVTGNYGIAIILLTAGVKIVTIPLMQTSFRSMRAMQKLQPDMQRLRERYKDDQTEMQKQVMELYRRNKVNPFAGCLPMVLQIPIFVGLYNALNHAIELRHAPFFLWINDLSAPDRLLVGGVGVPVLTLLMGLSMLVQQRMTPQQGDPAQQRMMMIMPLVFTYMFINFPAGLVLYWLVNNVLTIAQQAYMLREA